MVVEVLVKKERKARHYCGVYKLCVMF